MDIRSLPRDAKIVPIAAYASGTADRNSEVIDTLGYQKACVIVTHAAVHDSATYDIYLTNADAASDQDTLTSGSAVAGSSQTVAAADDNTLKFFDFIPTKRYYQVVFNKDATNACAESALVVLYDARVAPVTQAAGSSVIGEGVAAVTGEYLGAAIQGTK